MTLSIGSPSWPCAAARTSTAGPVVTGGHSRHTAEVMRLAAIGGQRGAPCRARRYRRSVTGNNRQNWRRHLRRPCPREIFLIGIALACYLVGVVLTVAQTPGRPADWFTTAGVLIMLGGLLLRTSAPRAKR